MAKTKVHGEYLDPSVISGQTQVTAVGADSVLIFDATDNALKKALLSDVIETVGSTPTFTSLTVDNTTINDNTIANATSSMILDSAGDIVLDADGTQIILKDNGTEFAQFLTSSTPDHLYIRSMIQDKDIILSGNDNGSFISALTLDMSAAGKAIFNAGATFGDNVTVGGSYQGTNTISLSTAGLDQRWGSGVAHTNLIGAIVGVSNGFQISQDSSNNQTYTFHNGGNPSLTINSSGKVGIGTSPDFPLHVSSTGTVLGLNATSGAVSQRFNENGTARFFLSTLNGSNGIAFVNGDGTSERMRIDSNGKVGINNTDPTAYYSDNLVVGCDDEGGMTLVSSATSHKAFIAFADGTSGSAAYRGAISYDHNLDTLFMGSAGGTQRLNIDSSANILVNTTTSPPANTPKAIKYGTGVQAGSMQTTTNLTAGSAGAVADVSSLVSGTTGAGMYLVTIVRHAGSYGQNHTGIYGVGYNSVHLYASLSNHGMTVSVSGTTISCNPSSTDTFMTNIIPLSVDI